MTSENLPAPNHEQEKETSQDVYYISKTGSLWSPMIVVGYGRDFDNNIVKYMLGDPKNPTETIEVPADWFDQHKDELRISEDQVWSVVGKPKIPVSNKDELPGQQDIPEEQRRMATVALGSPEIPKEDLKAEVDRLESELRQVYDNLSESDKKAVWQYAASISEEERALKLRYISINARNEGLHLKYRRLFGELKTARKKAGMF